METTTKVKATVETRPKAVDPPGDESDYESIGLDDWEDMYDDPDDILEDDRDEGMSDYFIPTHHPHVTVRKKPVNRAPAAPIKQTNVKSKK